ncbi:MAG: DUF2520 domain-containing protein [Desulfobacteraceae bacterium]|nr:DUF2520 domain-containing protein [Desulfobacteraceae bacterium]
MHFGFIGAGRVATAFGRYLHAKGISISGYFDRHDDKLRHACQATRSRVFQNASQVTENCDILFITTRDDQIEDVCKALCHEKAVKPHHLVGHMSGAHTSHILSSAEKYGAAVFSLHPLQAFANEDKALTDLGATYFSLEGENQRIDVLEDILKKLENPYFRIASQHKSLYHLAACIVSNYLITLLDSGAAALEKSGIDPKQGLQAMLPLIHGSVANMVELGGAIALTGPIARGDAKTIEQHIEALEASGLTDLKRVYTFMGRETLALASKQLLKDASSIAAVKKALNSKSST